MKFHNPKHPYDPAIKVGSLVQYRYGSDKGFWKIKNIEERATANPLVTIERVFDNYGRNASKQTLHCDAFYLKLMNHASIDQICTSGAQMFEDMKTTLHAYIDGSQK